MELELDKMSSDDLKSLIKDAEKALKTVDARRKAEAKRAAESAAREFGFSLDEVLGGVSVSTKGVAKYANPDDASQTWTGRGRKPKWVVEALDAGKSLEDMML